MKICNPISLSCDYCFTLELPYDGIINVSAGLTPSATFYSWITDKFGNQYSEQIIINADGSFDIDTSLYPDGIFNPDAGWFDLFISSDSLGTAIVPMTFIDNFNCLKFKTFCDMGCCTVALKKVLTSAQIKTGNTIPINFGIVVPAGKFAQQMTASFNYTANNGLFSFSGIDIITQGKTTPISSSGYIDPTADDFGQLSPVASSNQIAVGTDLQIRFNSDSISGNGTGIFYLIYMLFDM